MTNKVKAVKAAPNPSKVQASRATVVNLEYIKECIELDLIVFRNEMRRILNDAHEQGDNTYVDVDMNYLIGKYKATLDNRAKLAAVRKALDALVDKFGTGV